MMLADYIDVVTETGVRLLKKGEYVPLNVGFTQLDPDWVWVEMKDGKMVATLLACPCHGLVQLVRLVGTATPRLLRACVRDCYRRGYTGFITWLDPEVSSGAQLLRILRRANATVAEGCHLCVGVSAEELRKW